MRLKTSSLLAYERDQKKILSSFFCKQSKKKLNIHYKYTAVLSFTAVKATTDFCSLDDD